MPTPAHVLIVDRIRQHGPITFAQFMELALYHPQVGYYAAAARRSGRSGDFYTSVDVGPVFGALLAGQFVEMFDALDRHEPASSRPLDLVEVGAGNGRLARDVLDEVERLAPALYARVRLHLVETSAAARAQHFDVLGRHAARLVSSVGGLGDDGSDRWRGILFANELLDALPTHVVVGTPDGLREVYVDVAGDGLVEREGPLSTPALARYLDRVGARLRAGWRAEVNLAAVDWVRHAAAAIESGFIVLIDYGHEASSLYSATHAAGTLATFASHVVEVHGGTMPPWLRDPGGRDITAHVDFTTVQRTGEEAGLDLLCLVEQGRFLMALGIERHLADAGGSDRQSVAARLALKTLLMPGGIGSTHRVMVLGKHVASPALKGCLAKPRAERI